MFVSLDDPSSRDPLRVGAKAALLARAKAIGAPVLPGFIVIGDASRAHMNLGAEALAARGSGGARLTVSGEPVDFAESLIATGEQLGERLVARSSTLLESSGEWSGAFTSYLDLAPAELPKAVVGCWASAFSVAALERQAAAGIEPGSFPMSVLVQQALTPTAGGWARLAPDGSLEVRGIKGPPGPLLQGWAPGLLARYDGSWHGHEMANLIGLAHLDSIADLLTGYATEVGADTCEWALADQIWALQFSKSAAPDQAPLFELPGDRPGLTELVEFVRVLALAPGPLGEAFVLPWAAAGLPQVDLGEVEHRSVTIADIRTLSHELTEQVWGMPAELAHRSFHNLLDQLARGDIDEAIEIMATLNEPEAAVAADLLARIRALREEMALSGVVSSPRAAWLLDLASIRRGLKGEPVPSRGRVGVGRWEPLIAAVTFASGTAVTGTSASPGIGAGVRDHQSEPRLTPQSSRGVITAEWPAPVLAPLLWDASALVTASGSPAAHLFEATRSLRVPAVCGVDLGEPRNEILAVDGYTGVVATLSLDQEI